MSRRRKRLVVVAAALVGIAGLGYVSYVGFRQPVGSSPPPAAGGVAEPRPGGAAVPGGQPPVRVETARVEAAELAVEASAVGSLRSNESVVLRPEIAGRIASIHFRDGVAVGKGALLVALDSATQAAELDQAKANLGLAQANHQRSEDLFARKFISRQALDNAQAALKVQDAALSLAQAKFDKTRLRAPFAGIVGLRQVSVGDYVKEGQELVNIEDIGTLKIDFRLPESYLPQLRPGQRLEVSSDALPGQVFTAVLEAINPLVEAGGRAISLRAVLPNDQELLRPGMFVRVRLLFGQREKALLIPEEAVVPDSAAPYVYRVVDGFARRTTVRTGLRRGGAVEVTEGLSTGDEIVTAGQLKLREGAPVRPLAGSTAGPSAAGPAGAPAGQGR
ncbi:efflux RND transporter periplasmic adaptor subunit [Accumulibacter sp.]|uniref:efflux RND transporter periplasmic adaptor subunit n=1 Tax=Accumulibacter sp. TaxID=2053492 RepID=UPI0025D91D44|nr:efflux RND transporter periplasmic adaptor subunit [Accumulibacter sp.]MCM8594561.1 efflux RND transporter periplasmic adaptor subunit [Accumulibacter sp.]MCM8627409.1 efflux RND transporter periplasmic adaptor subunit [Accumulibacter sp.]MDS4048707.1 efflux RND transporter periplasmic adaptor subunit [Accumulibacter sp.]